MKKTKEIYTSFMTACDGVGEWVDPISNCNTFYMGLTKLLYDEKENILHVYVRRPGLLIGRGGENFDSIEKYVGYKIQIHEVMNLWD